MARKVFFSFEYSDVWRVMVVRNSWVAQGRRAADFVDAARVEKIRYQSDQIIKRWIDNQLKGTSVTVVLVGSRTCNSRWVKYEIKKSIERDNGLLGIDISKIPDVHKNISKPCGRMLPKGYKFYHWKYDNGYENMGKWIETAAIDANR